MSGTDGRTVLDRVLATAADIYEGEVEAEAELGSVGFDSIEMIQLAARLGAELGIPCTIDDVLAGGSLGGLARLLDARLGQY